MSKERLVPVVFLYSWHQYNAGEQAGFSTQHAENLVNSGIARFRDAPAPRPQLEAEAEGAADDDKEVVPVADGDPEPKGLTPFDNAVGRDLHARHRGGGRYYIYEGKERVSGPHTKKEIQAAGYG